MVNNLHPLISIVIPVFNESGNIVPIYESVLTVFETIQENYDIEFIFSDNHSTDSTFDELTALATSDTRVKVLRFNRNYGFQRSLLTAYSYASGKAAIQIDCDQQDPVTLIGDFLELWSQGHDVVVGLREKREESSLMTLLRRCFYGLLYKISDDKVLSNAGDFRLIDRNVLDHLKQFNHQDPYVRGLIDSVSINEAKIPYNRTARQHGRSKFPFIRLVDFARDGIVANSVVPLRLATYIGLFISILAFIVGAIYTVRALTFGSTWPRGFATTTVLILMGIGINGIFLGIIGEYIARIYHQIRPRPITVIEKSINIDL